MVQLYLADGTLLRSGSTALAPRPSPQQHVRIGEVLVTSETAVTRTVTSETPLELTRRAADDDRTPPRLVEIVHLRRLQLGDQAAVGTRLAVRVRRVGVDQPPVVEPRQVRLQSRQFFHVDVAVARRQRAVDAHQPQLELRPGVPFQTRSADRPVAARSTVGLQHVAFQTDQALFWRSWTVELLHRAHVT